MRICALLTVLSVAFLCEATSVLAKPTRDEEMVAMRDGVDLATDVYLPDGDGPWPCVLSRTPYGKNGNQAKAEQFAAAGFAFVSQDCRGRFKSAGKYEPFKKDHLDGYATVEWVARQAWSDGKVGMLGGSAVGITTNLAATQVPPHILSVVS